MDILLGLEAIIFKLPYYKPRKKCESSDSSLALVYIQEVNLMCQYYMENKGKFSKKKTHAKRTGQKIIDIESNSSNKR
jgi:hypothetical protein